MDETKIQKDPVVINAAHRFGAHEKAERFVSALGDHPHMKAIDEAIERASDSEPVESTPEQREAATKALMRFGLSGDPEKELDESVSSHPAAHKPKFARELPDRGRTIADNRRRQTKYGNH